MAQIQLLDALTINHIAAGEVVERPMSVVKELIENAIDAGADAITVEIKEGGIDYIRVTDNGCGIEKSQVPTAFLRHATSKLHSVEDLLSIKSLGFRGEALSSIAAVSRTELLTKTKEGSTGTRYVMEGAKKMILEDVGVPDGTTFIVRNLFFNTPARRKFLKSAVTEGTYITELVERIILSHPEVSFKYLMNGKVKLQSSGNNEVKDVIYQIYGRDITANIIPIEKTDENIRIGGFIGKPELARSNRNFEVYYVNQRYIKSSLISKALDEAYKPYLMLHKYPLVVLYLTIPFHMLDINVHPSKMELRFLESEKIYRLLIAYIQEALSEKELIPEIKEETAAAKSRPAPEEIFPEPFEINRREEFLKSTPVVQAKEPAPFVAETPVYHTVKPEQLNLFEEKFLTENSRKSHRIIGQVFDTYWLIEMEDKLYIIDQHAAHEKVKYERLLKQVRENAVISQFLNPPSIFSLSKTEEQLLLRFLPNFEKLGFEIEHFGGSEYSLRAVPTELFQLSVEDYFHELLDELSQEKLSETLPSINDRLATMACKSAVKGNNRLSGQEAQTLIDELLTLDNPYHCPHGRPTIISYSKYELEKKFKRIV